MWTGRAQKRTTLYRTVEITKMSTEPSMDESTEYMGVRFKVEALPAGRADIFIGRYTLMPSSSGGVANVASTGLKDVGGIDDVAHPSIDRSWNTENEALSYATQAAHSAIELLLDGRTQGQGNRSVASKRRLAGE